MKKFADLRNRIVSVVAVLILLVQSFFAVGLGVSYDEEEASNLSHQTEVKQEIAANASYMLIDGRITLPTFVYFEIARVFPIDVLLIAYQNCEAFFVNPHFFHSFYTYLSALAP